MTDHRITKQISGAKMNPTSSSIKRDSLPRTRDNVLIHVNSGIIDFVKSVLQEVGEMDSDRLTPEERHLLSTD